MVESSQDLPSPPSRRKAKLGLVASGLVLLALVVSLLIHLESRARFEKARQRFVLDLAAEVPSLDPLALRAQVASLEPDAVPEDENAARWFLSGAEALVLSREEVRQIKALAPQTTASWDEEQSRLARELVERNLPALELLHRARSHPKSHYGVTYKDFIDAEIPNLLGLLDASFLLLTEARLAFDAGDTEAGLAVLETMAHLTETLRRETLLIFQLIAHVTEKLQLQGISDLLTSDAPWIGNQEFLDRLETVISKVDLLPLGRTLVSLDSAIASAAAREGRTDLWSPDSTSRWVAYYLGHRRAAAYLDHGRRAAAIAFEPFGLLPDRELNVSLDPSQDPEDLRRIYLSSLAKGQLALSQRQLVSSALALRRWGLEHPAYPEVCPNVQGLSIPDPLAGHPLLCELRQGGGLRLSIVNGPQLAAEVVVSPTVHWILSLDLPAPTAPPEDDSEDS